TEDTLAFAPKMRRTARPRAGLDRRRTAMMTRMPRAQLVRSTGSTNVAPKMLFVG
ncbi:unnamed protein product, partial [Durusdinium trenchii]